MDQVAGSGEILHDSPRNNELLTLLCTFINPSGDFRTSAASQAGIASTAVSAAAANIVVAAANISDAQQAPELQAQLETFHPQQPSSSSDTVDGDCSCSGIDDCLDPSDEVTEEEIAHLGDIGPEIIESVTAASAQNFVSGEELIRPNNICKTINDITNNQQIVKEISSMPQNSLLEAALISNITSAAAQSSGDLFVQAALGMEQPQGTYHNWNVDPINSGVGANLPCDNSAYVNRQTFPVSGVNQQGMQPTFASPQMDSGYMAGVYTSQQQFNIPRHDQGLINDQMLHNPSFGVPDYQGNMLRTDAMSSGSQRQEMVQTAHSKMNPYQNLNFNPTSMAMSNNTDIAMPYTANYSNAKGSTHAVDQETSSSRVDSGSDENEDRTGEKKLTTTPLPSDAEKMSSSNSVSSGSHEDSPSPGEPEDSRVTVGNPTLSQSAPSNDYHMNSGGDFGLVDTSISENFSNGDMLLNEASMINSIPVPDSVVEIGDVALEYSHHSHHRHSDVPATASNLPSSTKSPGSGHQATTLSKTPKGDSTKAKSAVWPSEQKASKSKKHLDEMNDSWSVRKENRKRLHKKHKKSKHQEELPPTDMEGNATLASEGIAHRGEAHSEYRQRHRSKHHHTTSDIHQPSSSSSSKSSVSPSPDSKPFTYSNLIPKTTADPIGLSSIPGKSAWPGEKSKHWDGARKEKTGDKKSKHKKKHNTVPAVHHDHKIIAPASLQVPGTSSGSGFTSNQSPKGGSEPGHDPNGGGVRRWQTVTAIQGPKLPPMLSESDRIPKRGRPSKKMKEQNLKFKPSEVPDPVPQTEVKPSESASKMVSMYTINDKGFIEVLNQKPKENRRSKERAEAFRNFLTEISKRSSIQKKTAGAKDVVGAFKQIGVRTRNQASTGTGVGDEKKKRPKGKGKVFGGEPSSVGNNATSSAPETLKTEDGMYTFSELAKQYKISNSILYRAMEQSQRSMTARTKSSKTVQKPKSSLDSGIKPEFNEHEKSSTFRSSEEKPEKKKSPFSVSRQPAEDARRENERRQEDVTRAEVTPLSGASPSGQLPVSQLDNITSEKTKRKKKKKKHKKEKNEEGKRKKNKDKKKKKKKERRMHETNLVKEERREAAQADINNNNEVLILPYPDDGEITKKKHPKMSGSSTSSLGSSAVSTRPESTSSLSGPEEDNAYDGGDSSSDVETPLPIKTTQPIASADVSMQSSAPAGITQSVFGSNAASSPMPSFQGIKEYGGLVQFSEHIRKIEEMHDSKFKKHKHKKKKLVRRSKNIADPAFLYNMEELSHQLSCAKISSTAVFLSASSKPDNVFSRDFTRKSRVPNVGGKTVDDPLSYRDPSKHRFKSKRQGLAAPGFGVFSGKASSKKTFDPEQFRHVSTFCRLGFFVEHGLVKPYTGDSPAALLQSLSAQAPKIQALAFETPRDSINGKANKSQLSDRVKHDDGKSPQPQFQHQPLSETESESASSSTKRSRRKRGWPLGKPRGPRAKKSSVDEDVSTDTSDRYPDIPDKRPLETNGGKAANLENSRTASSDIATKSMATKTSVLAKRISRKEKSTAQEGKQSSETNSDSTQPGQSEKSQISTDLVNHIKAAIAASLTSASLPRDVVSKTVDSAVADYLNQMSDTGVNGDGSKGLLASPTNNKTDKKPRGRPPKQPKLVEKPLGKQDNEKGSEKPKKLWASKHEIAPGHKTHPNRTNAGTSSSGAKKRGPGRPRKFPVATTKKINQVRAPEKHHQDRSFPLQGARRANASFAPSARASFLEAQRKKAAKSKKQMSVVVQKRVTKQKIPTDTVISSQHARLALGPLLSGRAFREQVNSPAWLSSLNTPTPGLYHGKPAETHMNDAINLAVRNTSGEPLDLGNGITGVQTHKLAVKKSLESVVARLKSKQSHTDNDGDFQQESAENSNSNNNTNHVGDKRSRESSGQEIDDDGVPRKRMKSSDGCYPDDKMTGSLPQVGSNTSSASRRKIPEERKIFQTVGLFSPAFKMDSEENLASEDEDKETSPLFPPPLHAGKFLRKARKDFQLPYNVWWMYSKKLISVRQDPATQFVTIHSNVYVDTQPVAEQEEHICVCKTLSDIRSESSSEEELAGCGKECLNRLMYIECSPETCPCGEKCGNRSIQNKQWCTELERFRTQDRGWGVKTNDTIPEGQFILEYVGEVVSDREFRRRTIENYNAHNDHYCIQLEAGKVIDGYRMANEGRFVNHSCVPNCEMQKWVVNGEYRIGLFAKRKINPDEELTYDYNFHAYNLDRQQVCRCGAKECRGVIGGKTQRVYPENILNRMSKVMNKTSETSPTKPDKKTNGDKSSEQLYTTIVVNNVQLGIREIDSQQTPMLSKQERNFVRSHRLFLLRNLHQMKQQQQKIRQYRQKDPLPPPQHNGTASEPSCKDEAENKAELLERVITDVFTAVMTCKDENGISVAIPFINLPSKLQNPEYYQHVTDPLDLNYVEQKLVTKQYNTFDAFCSDLLRVFRNAEKYHGRKSTLGRDVARLRKAFTAARNAAATILGEGREKTKRKDQEAERAEMVERRKNGDFIRCICGIYKDEGVMIQCEKCYVWQHCDCMGVLPDDYNDERAYLCEECDERDVPVEVEVVPQPPNAPPGHTYYLTLTKDNMVVKQGDCVRVIHDHCLRQRSSSNPPVRTSYRLQSHSTPDRMDFLRIKKLWTDDNGDKFAYGHHFLRPHDVRHSDDRRFYSNELIASPFHEIVPLEAVVSICCVMDVETYCLGKPKGVKESDIYVLENKCNLSLRVVDKVVKTRYPVYTKPHVFDMYPDKLTAARDYQVPEQHRKTQARRTQWLKATQHGTKSDSDESSGTEEMNVQCSSDEDDDQDCGDSTDVATQQVDMEMGVDEGGESDSGNNRNEKKKRLNGILSKLMKDASSRVPCSQASSSGSE
uniref:Uncharacterized protein LOC778906 n=1 Tax=Phallusia mammillata TaxID=59560 RepID=A0A6F9DIR8_9ASCI|nr:uncharacterized protein LOC778906 [Phallusia mammillata]